MIREASLIYQAGFFARYESIKVLSWKVRKLESWKVEKEKLEVKR